MSARAASPAIDMDWLESNRRHLLAALAEVRRRLEQYVALASESARPPEPDKIWREPPALESGDPATPPALEALRVVFRLSPFERDVLLLCAGVELDGHFPSLCASAHALQGEAGRPYPTFGLALAALSEPHWSALTPVAPLRRWRLIEVSGTGFTPLTGSPLRIDERVLHYIAGIQHMDERLAGLVSPVRASESLVPSHRRLAERIASLWIETPEQYLPIIQLNGSEILSKEAVAFAACESAGLGLGKVHAQALPTAPGELEIGRAHV